MKKYLVMTLVMTIMIVMTACCSPAHSVAMELESEAEVQEPEPQASASASALRTDYETALPVASQLAIGILKLEETNNPLTVEQAGELRLLWKAALSLSESEITAAEETQAILTQIEEALTLEQLEAINTMQLTIDDMTSVMQELGIAGVGFGGGNMTPEMQATRQAARESGQAPQGRGAGGVMPGGGAPGGGEISPEVREIAMAAREGQVASKGRINPALVNAVIEYLEGITQ